MGHISDFDIEKVNKSMPDESKKRMRKDRNFYKRRFSIANIFAFIIICLIVAVPLYFSIDRFEEVFSRSKSEGTIVITEVLSGDADVYKDEDGDYSDWIEIYNPSQFPVNIKNYYLSDNSNNMQKFQLPNKNLGADEYLIIFASGKNKTSKEEIHTNFKIDSAGEEIYLVKQTTEVQKIEIPAMPPEFSYGIDNSGKWGYLKPITPNEENRDGYENIEDFYVSDPSFNGILINEYMSSKQTVFYDESGELGDWFEIINLNEYEVNLEGYYISDDLYNPQKWSFPNVALKIGEAIAIFADSKDIEYGDTLHTNFSLSPGKETLFLFDSEGLLIDSAKIIETDITVSYGRSKEDFEIWEYFSVPSPGLANTIKGYTQKKTANDSLPEYIYISEIKPISYSATDGQIENGDWIEIYNASDNQIDLSGFSLSDNKNDLDKWIFPNGSKISAREYFLVYASKEDRKDEQGFLHTNFKIDAMSESIILSGKNKSIIDTISPIYLEAGHSLGRKDTKQVYVFKTPTPNGENTDKYEKGYTLPVEFSKNAGQYDEAIDLELSCKDKNASIYYTIDGSTPTQSSHKYSKPISINKNLCIRAIAKSSDKLTSAAITHNYLVKKIHELPIVFISTDAENLYGEKGIITKASRVFQVPANIEIVEADNNGSISFDAGIRIFGNTSRYANQKSFAVELDEEFGLAELSYPLFLDDLKTPKTYKSFVLRNGGSEEWNRTKLTDASLMSLSRLGMNVDAQAYRPAAIYINGKYYGLINIREKLNCDYIETRYDIDKDLINIVEPKPGKVYSAVKGDDKDLESLVKYIRGNNLKDKDVYKNVEKFLDIDNYIDTILAHVILGNKDSGNLKFWKPDIPNSKWRLFLFDLDRAAYYAYVNHFETRTSVDGHGSGKSYDTSVLRGLLENEEFKYKYSKRAIELLDTVYSKEFATAYYDYLASKIDEEMDRSLSLWWKYSYNRADPSSLYGSPPGSKGDASHFVEHELNRHRTFFEKRQRYMYKYHKNYFDLTDNEIKKIREEIERDNSPITQIYDEFIKTGSIESAILLANTMETVLIYEIR